MHILRYPIILFALISFSMQAQQGIDFKSGTIQIRIEPDNEYIDGRVEYLFAAEVTTDSVVVDARELLINQVTINGKKTEFTYKNNSISIYRKFKAGRSYRLNIIYGVSPKKAVYFIGWHDNDPENNQVWTQGQGKYSSHWVPSFDDMSEKLTFNLEISFDSTYEVVANGDLVGTQLKDSLRIWKYTMVKPMSSYLLAFAAGRYEKDTLYSKSGIPLLRYSYKNRQATTEPTYRYTPEIMNFLEEEIGIPYPWQNYKQVPARDFLYAGMENTGTTIFSDSYLIDSLAFQDKNYVEINAHEMAHQWFGNLVTEIGGKDHWLHEGFATYYSLLARKELFGDDYYHWKLLESAEALDNEEGESLTDPGASSLTFYEKGAWALVMLRDKMGDLAFKRGIQNYLKTFAYG
ncbi:MAG: M1 family metallopeptidase, partial [Flavobacteriaceae bacterium]